jgi:hypothetical protein
MQVNEREKVQKRPIAPQLATRVRQPNLLQEIDQLRDPPIYLMQLSVTKEARRV